MGIMDIFENLICDEQNLEYRCNYLLHDIKCSSAGSFYASGCPRKPRTICPRTPRTLFLGQARTSKYKNLGLLPRTLTNTPRFT